MVLGLLSSALFGFYLPGTVEEVRVQLTKGLERDMSSLELKERGAFLTPEVRDHFRAQGFRLGIILVVLTPILAWLGARKTRNYSAIPFSSSERKRRPVRARR
jgi:hypothetical protein